MQGTTHVVVGVIIEDAFRKVKNRVLRFVLIAATALLCHSIFDRIARLTFHPPDADFSDSFWVGFCIFALVSFVVSLYFFGKKYSTGIVFSLLPDFDWVIIHSSKILDINLPFYQKPHIHNFIHYIIDHTPPFSFLQYLPNYTAYYRGALVELLIISVFLYFILKKGIIHRSLKKKEL